MPVYRITFGFGGNNQGWSETHAYSTSTVPALSVLPEAKQLATLRAAFLGYPFALIQIRVAAYSAAPQGARVPRQVQPWKGSIINPGSGPAVNFSTPANVAYEAIGYPLIASIPAAFAGNTNRTFLGGPMESTLSFATPGGAGIIDPGVAGLNASFNSWKNELIAPTIDVGGRWGWLAINPVGSVGNPGVQFPMPIGTITQLVNGTVEFVVNAVSNLVIGNRYTIAVSRINNSRSPLNGTWNAVCTAANTLVTTEVLAFTLNQSGGQIVAYSPTKQFFPYANVILGQVTVNHKRGRPFGSPRGRAPKRVRG
jgi:hypothetical protein